MTFFIDPQDEFNLLLADSALIAYGTDYSYNVLNHFNGSITLNRLATAPVPEPSSMVFGIISLASLLISKKKKE